MMLQNLQTEPEKLKKLGWFQHWTFRKFSSGETNRTKNLNNWKDPITMMRRISTKKKMKMEARSSTQKVLRDSKSSKSERRK